MVGFNIAEFSTKINERGTLQNNKFIVSITKPGIFTDDDFNRILEYRASNVRIPGVNFDVFNTYRYGVGSQQKSPINVNFNDITISFIETDGNFVWKSFAWWINEIFDFSDRGNGTIKYTSEYKQYYTSPTIKITIYNNSGQIVNVVVLKEAYPISLNDVGLSWSDKNNLMMINVGFTFREWYFEGFETIPAYESSNRPGDRIFASNRVTPTPQPSNPSDTLGPAAGQVQKRYTEGMRNTIDNFYPGPTTRELYALDAQAENNVAGGAAGR
jgi:hypothetical protein